MSLSGLTGVALMLIGFGFAYLKRNSHEGIGVYGIILGIIGIVLFCNEQRNLVVSNLKGTSENGKDNKRD